MRGRPPGVREHKQQAQLPAAAEPAIDVQINLIAVNLQMSPQTVEEAK